MNKFTRFLVAVFLLPHMAACGGAATRQASDDRTAAEASPEKTSKAARSEEPAKDAERPERTTSSRAETAETSVDAADEKSPSDAESKNTMDISVTADPSCVRRTETTTVTVKAERYSDISYGLSYADGQNHEQYGIAKTNGKGVYKKAFVVPLKAAVGKVTVLVAAMNADSQHGGTSEGTFEVVSTSC